MSENTKIEWADHTFNPWIGCKAISPGCANCYAAAWANRYGRDFAKRTHTAEESWRKPLQWERNAAHFFECKACRKRWHASCAAGHVCPSCGLKDFVLARQRVFCASLADVFDNAVPDEWRCDLWDLISATPHLDWLLLTKRIGNAHSMLPWIEDDEFPGCDPLQNVWLGATVCNQEEADRDIPKLLEISAQVRFLSVEPMLGPIDVFSTMTGELLHTSGDDYDPGCINWIIAGGESGHKARPSHPDWFRSLRDQCAAAGVPFLFKQWGAYTPLKSCVQPDTLYLTTKAAAGRLLDGIEHNKFPVAA